MAQSGFETLLEALKQSGVDVGGMRGGSSASAAGDASTGGNAQASAASAQTGDSESAFGGNSGGSAQNGAGSSRRPFGGSRGGGRNAGGEQPPLHIDFGEVGDKIRGWSRKRIIIMSVVFLLVLLAAYWWFHPPISINSVDTWMFVGIFILLPMFLIFRARSRMYETGNSKVDPNPAKFKSFRALSVIPVVIVALGLVGALLSLDLFPGNAQKYANVLQTQSLNFADDIQEVDYSQIPVIDHDSAVLLGNREMGSIPEYVSQFEVDDLYTQINYNNIPVRVSPLGYADLFKWLTNRENGIPAYAVVNMTTQDAEIVKLDEGMKYTTSEPLARNIDRYVQLKYPFYIFDEKAFEIDEDGQPWWVCPVRSYTIGLFGGETISRVVLCNAVTGECQDVAIEDVPEWVDRAYPSDLLIKQYNWSGSYINGWFNSWLGQSGVFKTTPGTDGENGYNYIVKDDDVWLYTGVTSATSDSSIIGFVLINQRTAESHYYSISGATEDSAMESAEGQVQNLRYTATFPILINVANQPTYFMALKDAAGLVKQFAMIDIQRYQNVAVGDTVAACQKSYEALLATNGVLSGSDAASAADLKTASGAIRTMAQGVVDGNSHFYVTLQNDSHIYDFTLPSLVEIVAYGVGDKISFTYIENDPTSTVQAIGEEAVAEVAVAASGTDGSGSSGSGGTADAASGANASSASGDAAGSASEGGQSSAASTSQAVA